MTQPSRRIIRPSSPNPSTDQHRQRQLLRIRSRLEAERTTLSRWQSKLNRAFNAVVRAQKKIARLEKQLAHLQE
jgi:transposase